MATTEGIKLTNQVNFCSEPLAAHVFVLAHDIKFYW